MSTLLLIVAATTILPVVMFGRMEGNTGAVVITSGLAVSAGLFSLRLASRKPKTPPKQSTAAA